jgi:hypothetical protein
MAVGWLFLSSAAALFVGGLVTSLFTAGENKTEAMLYGAIMWAVLIVMLLVLGNSGVHTGFAAMSASANTAQAAPAPNTGNAQQDEQTHKANLAAATKLSWYAFAGTWLSMIAAVAGALVGAGPTFRLVAIAPSSRGPGGL